MGEKLIAELEIKKGKSLGAKKMKRDLNDRPTNS